MSHVVVGYDGSACGADALVLARRICRATGDVAVVVTVYPDEHPIGVGRVDAEWVAAMREEAGRRLEHAHEILGTELEAEYRAVGSGSAAHGLHDVAEAEQATLIVVGSMRTGTLGRISAGSTAERLLHGAGCPVAVAIRGMHAGDLRHVGVAYLDTPDGHAALAAGLALAARAGAAVTLYSVAARAAEVMPVLVGRAVEEEYAESIRDRYRTALDAALARVPEGVEATGEVLSGPVAETLASIDCDLLVCGSRRYGPLRRVLLGGVSARVVRDAASPVMVVPRGLEAA